MCVCIYVGLYYVGVYMCGFCDVRLCVCVLIFNACEFVYVWIFNICVSVGFLMSVCICGFCTVFVFVWVGFVLCACMCIFCNDFFYV